VLFRPGAIQIGVKEVWGGEEKKGSPDRLTSLITVVETMRPRREAKEGKEKKKRKKSVIS